MAKQKQERRFCTFEVKIGRTKLAIPIKKYEKDFLQKRAKNTLFSFFPPSFLFFQINNWTRGDGARKSQKRGQKEKANKKVNEGPKHQLKASRNVHKTLKHFQHLHKKNNI